MNKITQWLVVNSHRFIEAFVKPILDFIEPIFVLLPLRLQGLFGLDEDLLGRLQLRRHGLIKLIQLNVFVGEPVEAAYILGKLLGFIDGVYIRQNISSIKKILIQNFKVSAFIP